MNRPTRRQVPAATATGLAASAASFPRSPFLVLLIQPAIRAVYDFATLTGMRTDTSPTAMITTPTSLTPVLFSTIPRRRRPLRNPPERLCCFETFRTASPRYGISCNAIVRASVQVHSQTTLGCRARRSLWRSRVSVMYPNCAKRAQPARIATSKL